MSAGNNGSAISDQPTGQRVFVSYSHDDATLVRIIVKYLEKECLLNVIWDETFDFGQGFHEQIRDCIAHAHVFLPVLTEGASLRGWVQQEIGFAMAMNIPVVPIAVGELPGQMISVLHAVKLESLSKADEPKLADALRVLDSTESTSEAKAEADEFLRKAPLWAKLLERLPRDKLARLIHRHADTSMARYQCADYQEERTILMIRHANAAYDLCHKGQPVLQLGGLSSFHIPIEHPSNEIWRRRYGKNPRGEYHKKLQRLERESLAQHANEAGCRLIVNPYHTYIDSGPRAYAIRLLCLRRFLMDGMRQGQSIEVAINHELGFHESLTIVGDYFAAAVIAGSSAGYMQTVFTTHAPSMQCRQDQFNRRFDESLQLWKWSNTCEGTCREIERILQKYLKVTVDPGNSELFMKDVKGLDETYDGYPPEWQPKPEFLEEDDDGGSSPASRPARKSRSR